MPCRRLGWQYIPFLALLGSVTMLAGLVVFSLAVRFTWPFASLCQVQLLGCWANARLQAPGGQSSCLSEAYAKHTASAACLSAQTWCIARACFRRSTQGKPPCSVTSLPGQAVPQRASLGTCGVVHATCWECARQALKSGHAIKAVVQLVGGSTSGFAHVAEAYWTTIVVTIVVSVVCLAMAIATYVFRMDLRMRQDLRYGGALWGALGRLASHADLAACRLLMGPVIRQGA